MVIPSDWRYPYANISFDSMKQLLQRIELMILKS